MKKKVLFLFFLTPFGCASINEPKFEGKALFDTNELHCPRGQIKYCEGRFRTMMDCTCVTPPPHGLF